MRLPRKLKKRIINTFGRKTYEGIIKGYLKLEKNGNGRGVIVKATGKPLEVGDINYQQGQTHPHMNFPTIY
jgi:hypothetical protein